VKVANITYVSNPCIEVRVSSESPTVHPRIESNGDIYAYADTGAPNAPTIDIRVFNTGTGSYCNQSYSYKAIELTVTDL
jgi:hypothetical protein